MSTSGTATTTEPPRLTPRSRRWIAGGLIAGTVLYVLPSAAHGNPPIESAEATLHYVAERSATWRPIHLVNIAAVLLWAVSLAALGDRLQGPARDVARAGRLTAAVATAVFAVYFSLHAMALPVAAARFVGGAADPAALLTQVEAVLLVLGATAFTAQALVGVMIGVHGLALTLDRRLPRWLGVVGLVAGLGWLAGAVIVDFAVIVPFTALTWLWAIVLGIVVWRRGAPAPAAT